MVSILNQKNSVQTPMVPSTPPLPISTSSPPTAGTIAEADPAPNAPPTLVSEHQDGPTEPHDALPQIESQPTIEGPSREVAAAEEDDLASPQSIPVHAPEDEGTSSGRLSQRESIPSSPTDTSTSEETDESDKSIEEDDQAGTAPSAPTIGDQPAGDISPGEESSSIIENRMGDPSEAGSSTSAANPEQEHQGEGVASGSGSTGEQLADGQGEDEVSRATILHSVSFIYDLIVECCSSGG